MRIQNSSLNLLVYNLKAFCKVKLKPQTYVEMLNRKKLCNFFKLLLQVNAGTVKRKEKILSSCKGSSQISLLVFSKFYQID